MIESSNPTEAASVKSAMIMHVMIIVVHFVRELKRRRDLGCLFSQSLWK
jgi:hypothetical protein